MNRIETDEITKSSIVYSRDELLALYVPSVGELELPKEMPVLSKSSLVPHIFQKFDFEEWNSYENRGRGRKRGGSATAAAPGRADSRWDHDKKVSKENVAVGLKNGNVEEDGESKWARGSKVSNSKKDLWDDVAKEDIGVGGVQMGMSDMAQAAQKFQLEMEKMRKDAAGAENEQKEDELDLHVDEGNDEVTFDFGQDIVKPGVTNASDIEGALEPNTFALQPILDDLATNEPAWPDTTFGNLAVPPELCVPAVEWFYLDPEGNCQGPFTSNDMSDWFESGYFTPTLPVRRGRGGKFEYLRTICGGVNRNPFNDVIRFPSEEFTGKIEMKMQQLPIEQPLHDMKLNISESQIGYEKPIASASENTILEKHISTPNDVDLVPENSSKAQYSNKHADQKLSANSSPKKKSTSKSWAASEVSSKNTSMTNIVEDEKKKALERRKIEKQKSQLEAFNESENTCGRMNDNSGPKTWGASDSKSTAGIKSLKEIQDEEKRRLQMESNRKPIQQTMASRIATANGIQQSGNLENMGNHLKMMLGVVSEPKGPAAQPTKSVVKEKVPQKVAESESQWSTVVGGKKKLSNVDASSLNKSKYSEQSNGTITADPSNYGPLMTWCCSQVKKLGGTTDMSILQFCTTLEDPSEIRELIAGTLGSTPGVSAFATEFIKRIKSSNSGPASQNAAQSETTKKARRKKRTKKKSAPLLQFSLTNEGQQKGSTD